MADLAWIREQLERFEGPLIRYANRFTGDLERARDVVQDTFCKLCQQQQEDVEDHVAEWLFTVCRNRALDVRKKEGRMTGLNEVELDGRSSADPAPGQAAELRDTTSKVLALVGTLPTNQRDVVRLKFQNGLSYKEISRVTDLSVSNVGFLLHVALKSLRLQLQSA